jgi:hypothetical protein
MWIKSGQSATGCYDTTLRNWPLSHSCQWIVLNTYWSGILYFGK